MRKYFLTPILFGLLGVAAPHAALAHGNKCTADCCPQDSKTCYGVKCVDYCLRRCPPLSLFTGKCGHDCGHCGGHGCDHCSPTCPRQEDCPSCKLRTKRVLLKKVV